MTGAGLGLRCFRSGVITGLLLGAAFGSVIVPIIGTVVGGGIGVIIGLLYGAVEAIVLPVMVVAGARLASVVLAGALTAGLTTWVLLAGFSSLRDVTEFVVIVVVTALAGPITALTVAPGPSGGCAPHACDAGEFAARPTRAVAGRDLGVMLGGAVIGALVGGVIGLRHPETEEWFAIVEFAALGLLAAALVVGLMHVGRAVVQLVRWGRGRHEIRSSATMEQ